MSASDLLNYVREQAVAHALPRAAAGGGNDYPSCGTGSKPFPGLADTKLLQLRHSAFIDPTDTAASVAEEDALSAPMMLKRPFVGIGGAKLRMQWDWTKSAS